MRKLLTRALAAAITAALVAACTTIDCPADHAVACTWRIDGGRLDGLGLTVEAVRGERADTVLLNGLQNPETFQLPMSLYQAEDTLTLTLQRDSTTTLTDTVRIAKTRRTHLESIDCPVAVFHDITAVSHTRHFIDSITVKDPHVAYTTASPHLLLHIAPTLRP